MDTPNSAHDQQHNQAQPAPSPKRRSVWLVIATLCLAPVVVGALVALICCGLIPKHRISRIFTAPFRSAEPADINVPIPYARSEFGFSYPANWQIDEQSEYHDPDSFLIIDAPKHGQIRIQLTTPQLDERDTVDQITDRFELPGLTIKKTSVFGSWGKLHGYGRTLHGVKFGEPFKIRIFGHSRGDLTLIVWEYWWDGPRSINASGFEFIAETFHFSDE